MHVACLPCISVKAPLMLYLHGLDWCMVPFKQAFFREGLPRSNKVMPNHILHVSSVSLLLTDLSPK